MTQHQHEENKEVEICKEPIVPRIIMHITHGVYTWIKNPSGDDQHHQNGKLICYQEKRHLN